MAFIATYISTTSASELGAWYNKLAKLTTTVQESIVQRSYDAVNQDLDPFFSVPFPKEFDTGRYHMSVKEAQALKAIHFAELYLNPHGDDTAAALEDYQAKIDWIKDHKTHFEADYSADEIGINNPVPGSGNTSTARVLVDKRKSYSGDTERTYTITVTTAGAVETAVVSWTDGEGTTTTGLTTSYDWLSLENNIHIRMISEGLSFVETDTWTIRGVPLDEVQTSSGGNSQKPVRQ